ncbi:MAG: hypothetical protein E7330_02905 [Clostridiales bacterium]|nr:hypothetical protein [Clostridiales bacterium]
MYKTKLKNDEADRLFDAILALESKDECYCFFEDLCTVTELRALSQRLEVAKLLRSGETYTAIAEKTGASTATISRVNRSLSYGADGYKTVLDKMAKQEG